LIAVLQWSLLILVAVTSSVAAVWSWKSRRATDARLRGLYAARMNICMGPMLIFIALLYMLMFSGSTLKVIIGALLILMGLFNLYAGIRNHAVYSRQNG